MDTECHHGQYAYAVCILSNDQKADFHAEFHMANRKSLAFGIVDSLNAGIDRVGNDSDDNILCRYGDILEYAEGDGPFF